MQKLQYRDHVVVALAVIAAVVAVVVVVIFERVVTRFGTRVQSNPLLPPEL